MQVVYNSPLVYVVDYPAIDAVEIIDKRNGRGALMRDDTAKRFREELGDLLRGEPDSDEVDDFIGHYSALMIQPAVYH